MAIKNYMVYGDLSSEKSSEAYPVMALCDDCVVNFQVVTCEGSSEEPCEECGCENDEIEVGSGVLCSNCSNEFEEELFLSSKTRHFHLRQFKFNGR